MTATTFTVTATSDDSFTVDAAAPTDFMSALNHLFGSGIPHADAHRACKDARYKGTATVTAPTAGLSDDAAHRAAKDARYGR